MDRRPRKLHQRVSESVILHLRPLIGNRNKPDTSIAPPGKGRDEKMPRMPSPEGSVQTREPGSRSLFLSKLPLEVRNAIYSYVWAHGTRDHHIYHRNRRLFHGRCVMDPLDEMDPDLIQKEMDRVYDLQVSDKSKQIVLRMWSKRLFSGSWGHRHWRCQERLDASLRNGRSDYLERDETDWMSLLLVCKQMYPEVLQSIFEYHTFVLSDVTSAHRFLVFRPPPLLQHIRHLELSLCPSSYEYGPFFSGYRVDGNTRLTRILDRLSKFTCLHELRISFDTSHRGFWLDIREKALFSKLAKLRVLGDFTVEFPAGYPLVHAVLPHGYGGKSTNLRLVRRPTVRWWISPGIPPMVSRIQRLLPTTPSQDPLLGQTARRPAFSLLDY